MPPAFLARDGLFGMNVLWGIQMIRRKEPGELQGKGQKATMKTKGGDTVPIKAIRTRAEIRQMAKDAGFTPAQNPETPCAREGCGRQALVFQALVPEGCISVLMCTCGNSSRMVYKRNQLSLSEVFSRRFLEGEEPK